MHNSDDKIVSISFDNKKFLDEVQTTIKALEQLNDATSGKNLKTDGIFSLQTAFQSLNRTAVTDVNNINAALKDGSAYETMSYNVGRASTSFNMLQEVATGALRSIGAMAVDIGSKVFNGLTSGIRGGWSEYNLLMDSTQTILANTERYGTTMNDVTAALDELNTYADKTIYNFSQMTRNIGYFTTAGQTLEDSVTAVRGMSNLGAFFGANNESVARATYQMSQAMSAGVVKLMDWRSLENASMAGTAFQEELMQTAAVMSGMSLDAFKEYIGASKGFRNTLEANWLTADVFLETLRKFAGESREYWQSLTNSNGEQLYTEEEIDRIMRLGEVAEDSATHVRTFKMMIDSLSESVGSGWAETFRILIGDLNQAKEFWTPINNLLVSVIGGVGDWRNAILRSWADVYREISINDLMVGLNTIGDIFKAIGTGITRAFGGTDDIAKNIGKITEALGDFVYTLRLDEEELEDVSDLVEGLLAPFVLLSDIIGELTIAFFNSTYRMNDFTRTGNSLADRLKPLRKLILDIFGSIGRLLTRGLNILQQSDAVRSALRFLGTEIKMVADIIDNVLGKAFTVIYNLWNKYDMTNKVITFFNNFIYYSTLLVGVIYNTGKLLGDWFANLMNNLSFVNFTPLQDVVNVLTALKDLLVSIVSPSMSAAEAFNNFKNVVTNTSIWTALTLIKEKIQELFASISESAMGSTRMQNLLQILIYVSDEIKRVTANAIAGLKTLKKNIKNTAIFNYLLKIKDGIVALYEGLKNTQVGSFLSSIITSVSDGIVTLISILSTNGLSGAITSFIETVKGLFESNVELKKPNLITAFTGISENVKSATSKMIDFQPFNEKLSGLRTVVTNVKSTIAELMPSGKNASRDSNVIKDFLTIITPVGEKADIITKNIEKVGSTFNAIGSIDTDQAAENTKKIAIVIAGFVSIFKWLVDTTLAFIAVISLLNFSKWSTAITNGLVSLAGAVSGGLTALATSIQISVTAISGAISSWANAVKEQAKAEEFKQIANIFKTLAILTGVLFVGLAIISQFGDPQAFVTTVQSFARGLVLIMMSIGIMVTMVILAANSLNRKGDILKRGVFRTLVGISLILWVVKGLLTRVIIFVSSIGALAIKVSELAPEKQPVFFKAIDIMMKMFVVILGALAVMMIVLTVLSNMTSTLDVSGIIGTKTIATITAATMALRGIMSAMTLMLLGVSIALAILVKATPNKELLSTAASILQWFVRILLIFVGVITFLAAVSDSFLIDGLLKAKALMDSATLNFTLFALSVVAIIAALGFVANMLINSINALTVVLANLENTNKVIRQVKEIMNTIFVFIGLISLILMALSLIAHQSSGILDTISMASTLISFGYSLLLVSFSMIVIATAISEIASIAGVVGRTKLDAAVSALIEIFVVVAACTAMFMVIGLQVSIIKTTIPTILTGAAAMYVAAHAVAVMAAGIALLAGTGISGHKIKTATDSLTKLFGVFTTFFGVMSVLLSLISVMRIRIGNGAFGMAGDKANQMVVILGAVTAAMFVMGKAAAVAAAGIALLVHAGSAEQIRAAVDGITEIMTALGVIFGIVSIVLAVLMAIPATELVGATIGAVLTAVAAGLLAIGGAIALAGIGMQAGARGIQIYADALRSLESIDTRRVMNTLTVFTDMLPTILVSILSAMPIIKDVIIGFLNNLAQAIAEAIVTFITTIYNIIVVSQSGVITMIGAIFVGIIDGVLSILADFMVRICGDGGRLWDVMAPLGEFLVKAADWAGYYGTLMAMAFVQGVAEALVDSRIIDLVGYGLYTLYTGAMHLFYETFGVTDVFQLGTIIGINVGEGIMNGLMTGLADVVNLIHDVFGTSTEELYEDLYEISPAIAGLIELADELDMHYGPHSGGGGSHTNGTHEGDWNDFQRARQDVYDEANDEYKQAMSMWSLLNSQVDEMLDESIQIGRHKDGEASGTFDFITTLTDAISSLFSTTSEGVSLFGEDGIFGTIFGSIFGDNPIGDGGITDGISTITDSLPDIFGADGEESGSSWLNGFTDAVTDKVPDADSIMDMPDEDDVYGKFGTALESSVSLPEDMKNPVISPVLDDTKFWSDYKGFEDAWNKKTYDEFAIDVGNSMTLREYSDKDATSDGSVSYNFTQINNSNKDLTRTEIYRDSKNLLRGSGLFRAN